RRGIPPVRSTWPRTRRTVPPSRGPAGGSSRRSRPRTVRRVRRTRRRESGPGGASSRTGPTIRRRRPRGRRRPGPAPSPPPGTPPRRCAPRPRPRRGTPRSSRPPPPAAAVVAAVVAVVAVRPARPPLGVQDRLDDVRVLHVDAPALHARGRVDEPAVGSGAPLGLLGRHRVSQEVAHRSSLAPVASVEWSWAGSLAGACTDEKIEAALETSQPPAVGCSSLFPERSNDPSGATKSEAAKAKQAGDIQSESKWTDGSRRRGEHRPGPREILREEMKRKMKQRSLFKGVEFQDVFFEGQVSTNLSPASMMGGRARVHVSLFHDQGQFTTSRAKLSQQPTGLEGGRMGLHPSHRAMYALTSAGSRTPLPSGGGRGPAVPPDLVGL
ncbi:hypothetical protein THAOC_31188, partial [Thalassiosira oceanica]